MKWEGTPDRALEWNCKRDRRCSLCKRLGPKEQYKPGPLVRNEVGVFERTWHCAPKCKKISTAHLDEAHGPRDAGEMPPRRKYVETMKYPKVKKATARTLKKDAARMQESAKRTSEASKVWSKTDAMVHPSPRSQSKPKLKRRR